MASNPRIHSCCNGQQLDRGFREDSWALADTEGHPRPSRPPYWLRVSSKFCSYCNKVHFVSYPYNCMLLHSLLYIILDIKAYFLGLRTAFFWKQCFFNSFVRSQSSNIWCHYRALNIHFNMLLCCLTALWGHKRSFS